ncbi:Uu.00g068130.m01.CDS01 [Anthostomella pinea]|uniref:Uu.00g068130.m01.CDS01 n=1 Tax=Anthostomella pinea TaxID=933095 RepID=A0AAI8VVG9_9PEZI|nr:Uu.00g068130.m01.CDS01 [Anthostomella pinea]
MGYNRWIFMGVPDNDPLWSSEQQDRCFGEYCWRTRGAQHHPISFSCTRRLSLATIKPELRENEEQLAVAFYKALWNTFLIDEKGKISGQREPAFASPEHTNARHFVDEPRWVITKMNLETVHRGEKELVQRKEWWLKGGGQYQELWFVEARIDRARGLADVGIRMCGSNTGLDTGNPIFRKSIQLSVFASAQKLLEE